MAETADLRSFIRELEGRNLLRHIEGADWNLEIGAITECVSDREGPALLFDRIRDYPTGYRILSNVFRTQDRFALGLGLPPELKGIPLLDLLRKKLKSLTSVPPVEVESGPVFENRIEGANIDVAAFPSPKWHDGDGGRYIGTGCCVITPDLETNKPNVGCYRVMVQGRDRVSVKMNKGKHGRIHMEKFHAEGRACPVAITLGQAPAIFFSAAMALPSGVEEYGIAGCLQGAPVEVVKSPIHKLPIPASAEIVLEGEIPPLPKEQLPQEGPFGEWPGYYADFSVGEAPLMTVQAIYHRNDPIVLGMPPLKPPNHYMSLPLGAALLWDQLESVGIPNVMGVWSFVYGGVVGPFVVVSIKQAYVGHSKQTLVAAAGSRAGAYGGKFLVVVDEDIDITDPYDVLWAMSTRCNPTEGHVDIVRGIWTSPADPSIPPSRRALKDGQSALRHGFTMDRVLIDACRPYAWLDEFPKVNVFPKSVKEAIISKWKL